jgi:hypothetical protein
MIENHPQDAKLTDGFFHTTEKFSDWFLKIKDHVNKGENPASTQDVNATVGVNIPSPVTNILIRIQSATSGSTDITADPQIAEGFDGQKITLEGMDDTKTVKLDNGTGLKLAGGASFTLGEDDVLVLHYNASKQLWIENSRSNN